MSTSRTRNTARNVAFGALNQIITVILNFVNRTIFIQILGAEYLGISGLFSDVLMMLSLADLGFGTAMAYSFYKPLAENNRNKIAALIKFYKKMYNIIALSVAVLGLALVPFLRYIVNLETEIPYLELYYLFFLANTVISYLFVYKTAIINADQKNYLISKYQLWVNCGRTIFQSLFLLLTRNYFIYLLIQVLATFVNNIIASRKANQLYPYIKNYTEELDKTERQNIFENMKSVFIYNISSVFLNATNNIFISIMVGTIWVGLYSNYYLVITILNKFINILYSSATASIGNVIVTENPKKKFEIFQTMQTISLIISCFTTVSLFVLLNDLIYVWLGETYLFDYVQLAPIILNFYLGSILRPIWSYRAATGLYIKTKYIMLFAAIESVILSILLGKYMGMIGILFASSISILTTYFWYEPKVLFKTYFEERVRNYYIPLVKNAFFTIGLIAILMFMSTYFTIDTWFKLLIKTFVVGLVVFSAVIVVYRRTKGFKMLSNRIRKLYKR